MTDHDEKKPKEPTSKKYYTCQLARQRATAIIAADVNDDPIEYNREKPTADAWAFPY